MSILFDFNCLTQFSDLKLNNKQGPISNSISIFQRVEGEALSLFQITSTSSCFTLQLVFVSFNITMEYNLVPNLQGYNKEKEMRRYI